jgi:hypothetical protein
VGWDLGLLPFWFVALFSAKMLPSIIMQRFFCEYFFWEDWIYGLFSFDCQKVAPNSLSSNYLFVAIR